MHMLLIILLIVDAIFLIGLILLQSSKSAGLSGSITGGAEQLFGKQKARGIDAVLRRATIIASVLLFAFAILIGYFV